jgi:nitrate/nitrite transporter NarK
MPSPARVLSLEAALVAAFCGGGFRSICRARFRWLWVRPSCRVRYSLPRLHWVLIFYSIAFFGHQLFSTVAQTAVVDLFPSVSVATAIGLVGGTGAFGAMIFSLVAGGVVAHYHSFGPLLVLAAVLHPLAFLTVVIVVGTIAPLRLNGRRPG